MAYSDIIRSSTAQMDDVADLMDGLLVDYEQLASQANRDITSTTYVDLADTTISITTGDGDVVLVMGGFTFSHSNQYQGGSFTLLWNNVGQPVPYGSNCADANSDRNRETVSWHWAHVPGAGVQTYKVATATAAGTLYVGYSLITALVFQHT